MPSFIRCSIQCCPLGSRKSPELTGLDLNFQPRVQNNGNISMLHLFLFARGFVAQGLPASQVCKGAQYPKTPQTLHMARNVWIKNSQANPLMEQQPIRWEAQKDWFHGTHMQKVYYDANPRFILSMHVYFPHGPPSQYLHVCRKLVRSKFNAGKRLADTYYNAAGKKCFKGNKTLKASSAYPPAFGREVPCPNHNAASFWLLLHEVPLSALSATPLPGPGASPMGVACTHWPDRGRQGRLQMWFLERCEVSWLAYNLEIPNRLKFPQYWSWGYTSSTFPEFFGPIASTMNRYDGIANPRLHEVEKYVAELVEKHRKPR